MNLTSKTSIDQSQSILNLTNQEWCALYSTLEWRELGVLLYVRTLGSVKEFNIRETASKLKLHRATVWICLIKLHNQKLVTVNCYQIQGMDQTMRDRIFKDLGIALEPKESALDANDIKGWNRGLAELLARFEVIAKFNKGEM